LVGVSPTHLGRGAAEILLREPSNHKLFQPYHWRAATRESAFLFYFNAAALHSFYALIVDHADAGRRDGEHSAEVRLLKPCSAFVGLPVSCLDTILPRLSLSVSVSLCVSGSLSLTPSLFHLLSVSLSLSPYLSLYLVLSLSLSLSTHNSLAPRPMYTGGRTPPLAPPPFRASSLRSQPHRPTAYPGILRILPPLAPPPSLVL
jgi:hypothetical protein